jgi:hypothetical protein
MLRSRLFWLAVSLMIVGFPSASRGQVAKAQPEKSANEQFEKLLANAMKAPEKADWKALRRAFAETTFYEPYNIEVPEKLKEIAKAIGRGETEQSEADLLKLLEQERFMRLDTNAMLMMLYEKTGPPEKAEKYKKILDGILGVLNYPKEGTSFDNPIEVIFIEEEYFVITNMPLEKQSLAVHDEHWFDIMEIKPVGDQPARKIYFKIDLPHNSLSKRLEKLSK